MSFWRFFTYGLRTLVRGAKRDNEVAEEVEQYFEEATKAWMQRGLSRKEAERAARLEFGSAAAERDQARSYGWEHAIEIFLCDLRFSFRQLFKNPAFTVTAALTLILGIGANTAVFSVVESVLLAPLPYRNAASICVLKTYLTNLGRASSRVTGPDASDVRAQASDFAAISLYNGGNEGVQLRDHAVYTVVTWADANFSHVFSLEPVAGRLFTDGEAHRAALVSEEFARDNFGGAQAALGQTLHIENEAIEIVGVLPGGFDFPGHTQIWEAASLIPESKSRTAFNYKAVGLLRSGINLQAAQTQLAGISQRLQADYPSENLKKVVIAQPLQQALIGDVRPTLMLLWAMAGLLLLVACVNVTHLELVQSAKRQREIAMRKALGATRWNVARPILLESLLVAGIGGATGVLIASPVVRILVAAAPKDLPRAEEIHLNGWVLLFTFGLSILTAVVSAMLPVLRAMKVDPAGALKRDSTRGLGHKRATTVRNGLVIAEVAATFVLVVGAGLLLHTISNLMTRSVGYDTLRLLVVDSDAPAHSTEDALRVVRQFNQVFAQLAGLPGVEHAAGIMGLPMGDYGSNGYYNTRGGLPIDEAHKPSANFSVASPEYFGTMGIPIVRGRDFNFQDAYESPFVAVISQSLANQSFGDADPIGKQIQCGLDSDKWMTVIGVVGDVRQDSPAEEPGPTLYMPMAQHPFYANQIHIVLRTNVRPLTLIHSVQNTILSINPSVAMRFTTMDEMVGQSMAAERFRAQLISFFAGVGLLLAMLGVYGTMAYSVTQRTFEIGIRMAFGAERGSVLRFVLRRAAVLACSGIAIGLVLSLILGRLVSGMLVVVRPTDPLSLVGSASLLLLTALGAALFPGWKATRVDPMTALRVE